MKWWRYAGKSISHTPRKKHKTRFLCTSNKCIRPTSFPRSRYYCCCCCFLLSSSYIEHNISHQSRCSKRASEWARARGENVGWRELMKLRNRCHIDPDAIRVVESLNLQLSQNPNLIKRDPEHTTSEERHRWWWWSFKGCMPGMVVWLGFSFMGRWTRKRLSVWLNSLVVRKSAANNSISKNFQRALKN